MTRNISPYLFSLKIIMTGQLYFNVAFHLFDYGTTLTMALGIISTLILQWGLNSRMTSRLKEGPVKVWSPIPVKFDKWRFTFYFVDYTTAISGPDLFDARLKGTPVTRMEKFKAEMDDAMNSVP